MIRPLAVLSHWPWRPETSRCWQFRSRTSTQLLSRRGARGVQVGVVHFTTQKLLWLQICDTVHCIFRLVCNNETRILGSNNCQCAQAVSGKLGLLELVEQHFQNSVTGVLLGNRISTDLRTSECISFGEYMGKAWKRATRVILLFTNVREHFAVCMALQDT